MQAGGSLILSTRLKDGMTTDSTGQPVPWWFDIYLRKESQHAEEFRIFTVNKSVTADGNLLTPTGGVKGMYPAPSIHEHFTIHKWLRQTAYIFTHNFNIANNCMSAMTHTDVTTAHHCLTRIPWKIPCATPASGAWSAWTMSHPTLFPDLCGERMRTLQPDSEAPNGWNECLPNQDQVHGRSQPQVV